MPTDADTVLVVERSKWNRGLGYESAFLLGPDGRLSCLGFLAIARGASSADILNKASPTQARTVDWPRALFFPTLPEGEDAELANEIMFTEVSIMDESAREAELIRLMSLAGVQLTFAR